MGVRHRTTSHAWLHLFAIGAFVSVLAAYQTTGTQEAQAAEVTAQLPPMQKPERNVGFKWVSLKDGKEVVFTLVAKTADRESWQRSDGCSWTKPNTGFAPAVKWSGCASNDGTSVVNLLEGNPWPLQVGKKWTYSLRGSNVVGYSWDDKRHCEVKGVARIKTKLGEHDTYKVVCTDPWQTRTWYMSPSLKAGVRYIKDHDTRGKTVYEFIRAVEP